MNVGDVVNYFMQVVGVCEEPDVLKVVAFIKTLLNIVFIIVPILLILFLSLDLFKNVVGFDEDAKRKNISMFVKRVLMCVCVFLVPTIVNFLDIFLSRTISSYDVTYQSCYQNADKIWFYESLKTFREKEASQKEEKEKQIISLASRISKVFVTLSSSSGGNNGQLTFDSNDVTKVSNASLSDLQKALNNYSSKKAKNFLPYASKYLELEKKHGVNAFFVLGVHALESGWLTSDVTKKCNNIGGVKYAKQKGATKCSRTSEYSSEKSHYAGWSSIDGFLDYYFAWIKKSYLTKGGEHYHGTSIEGFNTSYNGKASWANQVKSISNSLYKAAKG